LNYRKELIVTLTEEREREKETTQKDKSSMTLEETITQVKMEWINQWPNSLTALFDNDDFN
jgi:hypothetical protein